MIAAGYADFRRARHAESSEPCRLSAASAGVRRLSAGHCDQGRAVALLLLWIPPDAARSFVEQGARERLVHWLGRGFARTGCGASCGTSERISSGCVPRFAATGSAMEPARRLTRVRQLRQYSGSCRVTFLQQLRDPLGATVRCRSPMSPNRAEARIAGQIFVHASAACGQSIQRLNCRDGRGAAILSLGAAPEKPIHIFQREPAGGNAPVVASPTPEMVSEVTCQEWGSRLCWRTGVEGRRTDTLPASVARQAEGRSAVR